jgi:AcrR family transcriptional regulator
MARPKPDPETVFPLILAAATALIKQQGFDRLTMKSLAQACGMSVGKLYRFFPGKDDLFLHLEIDYFDTLYQRILVVRDAAALQGLNKQQQFVAILRDYYDFAVSQVDLYKLVTSPPKVFSHYKGTTIERLAEKELQAALRTISLFRETYFEARAEVRGDQSEALQQRHFLLFVNSVHGLILMSQSPVWPYVSNAPGIFESGDTLPTEPFACVADQLDLLVEKLL